MLMPWLGHAATLHYYVLRDAPGPVAWMPGVDDPLPPSTGRTWYLLHLVGWENFPDGRSIAQFTRMVERLGTPSSERFDASEAESVIAYAFGSR